MAFAITSFCVLWTQTQKERHDENRVFLLFVNQLKSKAPAPYVTKETITPAVKTPNIIAGSAFFSRISSKAATSAPVQAPVPGKGIATNMNSPQKANFCTVTDLACALFSNRVTKLSSFLFMLLNQLKIFLMNIMINGTGTRLPIMDTPIAIHGLSPIPTPIGIAPRNSIMGTIEIKKVIKIFPI